MNYFFSIDNHAGHYWQAELLLESLSMLDASARVTVGIAKHDGEKASPYGRHLSSHKNVFMYEPVPAAARRLVGFLLARQHGVLQPPYCLLHADMVVLSEPKMWDEDIILDVADDAPRVRPGVEYHAKIIDQRLEEVPGFKGMPDWAVGGVVVVNKEPEGFLQRLWDWTQLLIEQGHAQPDRGAAYLTLSDYYGHYSVRAERLSMHLIEQFAEAPVIHYRHGLPPFFHKSFYGESGNSLGGDPMEVILAHNTTTTQQALQTVVRSYLRKS